MPSMPESISSVFQPAIAIKFMASAASDAEYFVLAPISRALSRRASKSFPVAPLTAATLLMEVSKSAAVFTAAVPRPPMTVVTPIIFFPAPAMVLPAFSNFPPTSLIFARVVLVLAASSCRRCSSCSVSTISLCRASYLSCPSVPFSSCCFACICAAFSVSSLSFVAPIASFKSRCFCDRSSVLLGSSFSSLFTSRRDVCVVRSVDCTPFRALSKPVVSPPISTVIPLILLATQIPPLCKNGHEKRADFSTLEKYFI